MSDFRSRPNGSYIDDADWQQLYLLTERWKSDLKFLRHLIDTYFMWISKKENIDMVREIEIGLLEMDNQSSMLFQQANKQLHHLAKLIDNSFDNDSHEFRTEHKKLEDDLTTFVKDFRKNRKEVFTITEHVIDEEEMVRRLNLVSK